MIVGATKTLQHTPAERPAAQAFNPYRILGVAEDATPQEIRKRFRELSVTMHPDKRRGEEKDVPEAVIEAEYQALVQADEILRDKKKLALWKATGKTENDRQFESFKIALPTWLTTGKNRNVVLVGYLALVVLLPVGVYFIYRRSVRAD